MLKRRKLGTVARLALCGTVILSAFVATAKIGSANSVVIIHTPKGGEPVDAKMSTDGTIHLLHAQVRCVAERPNQKFSIIHKLLSQVSPWKARYFPSGEGSGLIIHRRRPFGHRRVTVPVRVAYTKSNESAPQQLIKKPLPCVAHA